MMDIDDIIGYKFRCTWRYMSTGIFPVREL